MRRLRVAVVKLTSCSGCLSQLLNIENGFYELMRNIEFKYFPEIGIDSGSDHYDVVFIEGSVTTEDEAELVREFREKSTLLVAIGACAVAGGIQALRNWLNFNELIENYPKPEFIKVSRESRPIRDYVKVDYELGGCPVSKDLIAHFIKQVIIGKRPYIHKGTVCQECKLVGNSCLIVSKGIPCLGPITRLGCNALCPTYGRGCYGCNGVAEGVNIKALIEVFKRLGLSSKDILLKFRMFTPLSVELKKVIDYGGQRA